MQIDFRKGWDKYKTSVKLWKDIDIPTDEKTFFFTLIHEKIENISKPFGENHAPCCVEFSNNSQRAFSKYGHKETTYGYVAWLW